MNGVKVSPSKLTSSEDKKYRIIFATDDKIELTNELNYEIRKLNGFTMKDVDDDIIEISPFKDNMDELCRLHDKGAISVYAMCVGYDYVSEDYRNKIYSYILNERVGIDYLYFHNMSAADIRKWYNGYKYYQDTFHLRKWNMDSNSKWDDPYFIYSKNQLMETLQRDPVNNIVAFISDNEAYTDWLFSKLKTYSVEDDTKVDASTGEAEKEFESIESEKCIPLRPGLPKLFEGWIYNIWYKDKSKDEGFSKDEVVEEIEESTTESYIKRTLIIKLENGDTITYVHIKPSIEVDLSDVIDDFGFIWFDLNTDYKSIVMGDISTYELGNKLDGFTSLPLVDDELYDNSGYLNVVKNALTLNDILNKGNPSFINIGHRIREQFHIGGVVCRFETFEVRAKEFVF